MDTLNPLPEGTVVRIRLRHGDSRVEANGTVVYQVPGLGMGIAFNALTVENQSTLNEWLSDAGDHDRVFQASLPPIQVQRSAVPGKQEERLVQLIEVLRQKGILTTREAAALLHEPVKADV